MSNPVSLSESSPRHSRATIDPGTITIQYPSTGATCQLPVTVYGVYDATYFPVITCEAIQEAGPGRLSPGQVSIITGSMSWSACFSDLLPGTYQFRVRIFHPPSTTPDGESSV